MTGVEGYIESAASGILAAHAVADRLQGKEPLLPPPETMMGALCRYISDESVEDFQPMGSNMGILPPLPELIKGKQERYQAMATGRWLRWNLTGKRGKNDENYSGCLWRG